MQYISQKVFCKITMNIFFIIILINGAINIYRIAKNAINKLKRPKYLCREKKDENIKVEKPKKEKIIKVVQNKVNKSVKVTTLTKS